MSIELVPKVTVLPVLTTLDVPTERILQGALDSDPPLKSAVVVGVDADGQLYFASSFADGGSVLWWLEKAKQALLCQE